MNPKLPNSDFVSFMDWDFLKNSVCINKIIDSINLPEGTKKIVLERDDDYSLKGTLRFDDRKFMPKRNATAGSFDKGFDVAGTSDDDSMACDLQSCHVGSVSFQGASDFVGTADLRINTVRIKFSENTPNHLWEWYLNGPNDHACFGTAEKQVIHFLTKEQFLSYCDSELPTTKLVGSFSTQLIWPRLNDFKLLITIIPSLGPKWSTNVGIEYREDWGRIPEPDERLKIEELCSFVFGKHLLSVGHTTYDKDENIIEVHAHSPWGRDARLRVHNLSTHLFGFTITRRVTRKKSLTTCYLNTSSFVNLFV